MTRDDLHPGARVRVGDIEGEVVTIGGFGPRVRLGIKVGAGEVLFLTVGEADLAAAIVDPGQPAPAEEIDISAGLAMAEAIAAGGDTHGSVTLALRVLAATALYLRDKLHAATHAATHPAPATGGTP